MQQENDIYICKCDTSSTFFDFNQNEKKMNNSHEFHLKKIEFSNGYETKLLSTISIPYCIDNDNYFQQLSESTLFTV